MTPSMGHGCCRLALTSFLLPLPSSLLLPTFLFFWPAAVVPVARCTNTPVGNTKCPNTSVPAAVCSDSERKEAAISMDCHGGRGEEEEGYVRALPLKWTLLQTSQSPTQLPLSLALCLQSFRLLFWVKKMYMYFVFGSPSSSSSCFCGVEK